MTQSGVLGEQHAAQYLEGHGYRIIARNFRTRFGEIDIIAQKDDILAFVEVKTRAADAWERPAQAVTAAKQKRLITTAMLYLEQNPSGLQPRFDVIEVVIQAKSTFSVLHTEHLTGAFEV